MSSEFPKHTIPIPAFKRRRSELPIARAATGRTLPVLTNVEIQRILDKEDQLPTARLLLALEQYRERRASLSKAAEVAGVSLSEMVDLLAEHGIPADLRVEDYREGLRTLREIW
jgi:predicted HTH domain antitoxin